MTAVSFVTAVEDPARFVRSAGSTWIDDAVDSNVAPIMRFARVLHRDIDAIYNAIELPWTNGQAEGQNESPQNSQASNVRTRWDRIASGESATILRHTD